MHIILKKNVESIKEEFQFDNYNEAKLFEIFCNYCIVKKYFLGRFNPIEVTTDEDDASLDGIAFIIDGELITTEDDATQIFTTHKNNLECKIIITQAKSGEKFKKNEISNFNTGILDFLSLEPKLPNGELNKEALKIFNVVLNNLKKLKNKLPDINIFYCTSGNYEAQREIEATLDIIKIEVESKDLFESVEVTPLGRNELLKLWKAITENSETKLKLKEYFGMPPMPNIKQSYVTLVNAKEFVEKVLLDENNNIKHEIFEENIRAFLGDGDVNNKIQGTLDDEDKSKLFSVLNNGITIVTPELTLTANSKEIELVNYQIINGCQTSHRLYENYEKLTKDINVVVKCIESANEDNVTDIISATNSQTKINDESFFSLKQKSRLVQKYFEIENSNHSKENHIYFERRENEYKNKGFQNARVFDIKHLCRAYNAMFLNEPFNSARYVSKIFEIKKEDLFKDSDEESMYYSSALTLYRFNNLVNIKKNNAQKYVYLRWHIIQLFKLVVHKDINNVKPNSNTAKKYCESIIKKLNSKGRNYEEIFEHCYKIIDSIPFPTKDILKRPKYNNDLLTAAKKYIKDNLKKK